MKKLLLVLLSVGLMAGCSRSNVDDVKAHAVEEFDKLGFEIIANEGYQMGLGGFGTPYGGAKVWYLLKTKNDDGIVYNGYLQRWGVEYHLYNIKALNAFAPTR